MATCARHSQQCVIHFNVLSPSRKELNALYVCTIFHQPFLLITDQLHTVMAHIEDLVEINGRVQKADLPVAYHDPQVSETNDI